MKVKGFLFTIEFKRNGQTRRQNARTKRRMSPHEALEHFLKKYQKFSDIANDEFIGLYMTPSEWEETEDV